MKQYIETESSGYQINGMHIPNDAGNRHYREMLELIEAGEAKIVPFDHDAHADAEATANSNEENRRYLQSTDWYVVRFQETGEAIPQDISDARAAARLAIVEV